jgi:3-phosphoshikimate 1-carboxyvinyltransferase
MINLSLPGSKSITNRAVLIASLAKGKSVLTNALESEDTFHMQKALKSLGVKFKKDSKTLVITGKSFKKPRGKLFCGNAGTAMRFLTAVLSTQSFESTITGDSRMKKRPIKDLVGALKQLGAKLEYMGKNGYPPLKIKGPLLGGTCKVKGDISSQFLSGLLIAAPLAERDVTIEVVSELVSRPYVDMTIQIMEKFGVKVIRNGYKKFIVKAGQKYLAKNFKIEGDASSASYFWGISALTGEKIEITNIPKDSLQADCVIARELERPKQSTNVPATTIDCTDFPDSAMTLAVVCAFRKGKTTLTGLSNLRVKECDRLHALATELTKIGCKVKELAGGLIINGDPEKLHSARIRTYSDHRVAMCFGMAGVVLPNLKIENPNCVKKTYPNFWKDLAVVKQHLQEKNIILTGMRGSGKTKLGAALGRYLGRRFIDVDWMIEQTARKSIAEIVESKGWKEFRKLESKVVEKLSKTKHSIIATGGGTLMNEKNANLLKKNGKVIFLESSLSSIKKRLLGKTDRPSLIGKKDFLEELADVYKQREKRYKQVADATVDVSLNTDDKVEDLNFKLSEILSCVTKLGLL